MDRSSDVLNSWKEIAVYLDRSVRSVQRWETDCGLPVRRVNPASDKSPVIASRVELDDWLQGRRTKHWDAKLSTGEAIAAAHQWRAKTREARAELRTAIATLQETVLRCCQSRFVSVVRRSGNPLRSTTKPALDSSSPILRLP
jgi:hypothetical protein